MTIFIVLGVAVVFCTAATWVAACCIYSCLCRIERKLADFKLPVVPVGMAMGMGNLAPSGFVVPVPPANPALAECSVHCAKWQRGEPCEHRPVTEQ
jgi:hypothetical protein